MITAGDVKKLIDKDDPAIDGFIENVLVHRFINSGNDVTRLSINEILNYFNGRGMPCSVVYVARQLKNRGFSVTHECDDRPAGSQWVRIEIPPQGD